MQEGLMTTSKRHIPINNNGVSGGPDNVSGSAGPKSGTQADDLAAAQAPAREMADQATDDTAALTAERNALADSLLRLRAEFENYRKRASRELVEARVRAQGELLSELLPVLDNLERALEAAEHHEEGKVLDGVRLTRNLFVGLLARAGVEEIECIGAPFDPQVHDAVLMQPSEREEGAVCTVLERGYRQGDRVLRPARVVVSAGSDGATASGAAGGSVDAAPTG
jgi:molecular chaperone GrpE